MSKDEFVKELTSRGYIAEMSGSLPMVYTEDITQAASVSKLAKTIGYQYSFGVKQKVMPRD